MDKDELSDIIASLLIKPDTKQIRYFLLDDNHDDRCLVYKVTVESKKSPEMIFFYKVEKSNKNNKCLVKEEESLDESECSGYNGDISNLEITDNPFKNDSNCVSNNTFNLSSGSETLSNGEVCPIIGDSFYLTEDTDLPDPAKENSLILSNSSYEDSTIEDRTESDTSSINSIELSRCTKISSLSSLSDQENFDKNISEKSPIEFSVKEESNDISYIFGKDVDVQSSSQTVYDVFQSSSSGFESRINPSIKLKPQRHCSIIKSKKKHNTAVCSYCRHYSLN